MKNTIKHFSQGAVIDESRSWVLHDEFIKNAENKISIPQFEEAHNKFVASIIPKIWECIAIMAKMVVLILISSSLAVDIIEFLLTFTSTFINNDGLVHIIMIIIYLPIIFIGLPILIGLFDAAYLFFHECLHGINRGRNFYLIDYGENATNISCFSLKWESKGVRMFLMILQFVSFLLLGLLIYFLTGHILWALFFILRGVHGSSLDVGAFFIIWRFVPSGVYSFGHFYLEKQ